MNEARERSFVPTRVKMRVGFGAGEIILAVVVLFVFAAMFVPIAKGFCL